MKIAITKLIGSQEPLRGDICKAVGDCMIALEALETAHQAVCTTNVKDFEPICNAVGVNLYQVTKK